MSDHDRIKKPNLAGNRPTTIHRAEDEEQLLQSHKDTDVLSTTFDSPQLNPSQILHLQRTIGNAAVQRLLNNGASVQRMERDDRTSEYEILDDTEAIEAPLFFRQSVPATHDATPNALQRTANGDSKASKRHTVRLNSKYRMVQRENFAHRWRRRIGRWLQNKQLPTNTYRWDTRAPNIIARDGFQPWKADGDIKLEEHVNNAFSEGVRQGEATKHESQWVSTGAYGMLKKLDPTFAQQVLDTNLYKIDTAAASETGDFTDANDHFDTIGQERPYASQREWIKQGGIPAQAIVGFMTGQAFMEQYDIETGAPDEAALNGWQNMPAPADAE
jgi:hypothetical protein